MWIWWLDPYSISEEGGVSTVTAELSGPSSEATTVTVTPDPYGPAAAWWRRTSRCRARRR